ncbi:hypothetical protein jhhlp_006025 [Lomentospora prolificans]|uniref:Uncharacterized protein n=1 Tax=Lomentospora prolificans TaxID=41688 RepID=A0A2N3N4U7_9PEZI|nr:hypothetical protein jhhlp_006025 [Lomentospora prolificans]
MRADAAAAMLAFLATTVHAFGAKPSPKPTKVETFKWKYPFEPEAMASYNAACEASEKFGAHEYTLHELMDPPPKGLGPWAPGLKDFFTGREYPGGWGGWDRHLHDRSLLKMEYVDMPLKVREWIEEQERTEGPGKGLFGVFQKPKDEDDTIEHTVEIGETVDRSTDSEKVAIFAPGAIYEILPLWIAEGSNCEEQFSDLSKYQATHADGAVIAWPSKTNPNAEKLISIKIDANVLARKEGIEEPVEEKKDEEVKEEPKEDKQPEEKKADEKDEL